MKNSLTMAMWSRTTKTRKEWAERGATTIPAISRQPIIGATERKDQPGWTTSGRSGIFLADLIHLVKVADDDALLPSSISSRVRMLNLRKSNPRREVRPPFNYLATFAFVKRFLVIILRLHCPLALRIVLMQ